MDLLCSRCSEPLRPVFVCDIDGTLAEYHQSIAHFTARYWNIKPPVNHWNGEGDMEDWIGVARWQYQQAKLAYRAGGFKRFNLPFPGGQGLMFRAKSLGCEVWIATHRPWLKMDNIDPDTRWWLQTNMIPYDYLLYSDDKFKDLAERVDPSRVAAILEDLPEVLVTSEYFFPDAWRMLIRRSYNDERIPDGCTVVESLPQAGDLLQRAVQDWRSRNEQ